MDININGKVALVTGGAQGIGAAIVAEFLRSGAKAVYIGDLGHQRQAADRMIREIGLDGAEFVELNVTSPDDHARVVEQIVAAHGGIDILVNNAGVGPNTTSLKSEPAKWDLIFNVCVRGPTLLSQAVIPQMVEKRSGVIINIASVAGVVGIPNHLYYTQAKHAIVGGTRVMAKELVTHGIRVCAVAPARTDTPWVRERVKEQAAASGGTKDEATVLREFNATQASGRMVSPEEIAARVLYLASDYARAITGSVDMVDDCWTAV